MQGRFAGQVYDVFISHGPDTKTILVNLLASRLENHGITVFYDNNNLEPTADLPAWEIMKASLRAAKIQVCVVSVVLKAPCFLLVSLSEGNSGCVPTDWSPFPKVLGFRVVQRGAGYHE